MAHFTFRVSIELDGMLESPWRISTGIDSKGAIALPVPNILRKHEEAVRPFESATSRKALPNFET